ncbi:hypothetical protein IRJ41_002887 [Triplophysa rosa]|uniref:Uncharacterized protein n=1 Tax=Triplophysa rosa TaxID=992332 RepID=A0A9W7WS90_TRIRA|nr:hypothetical protein IRJ41_002887 [Triplophysa rosa]
MRAEPDTDNTDEDDWGAFKCYNNTCIIHIIATYIFLRNFIQLVEVKSEAFNWKGELKIPRFQKAKRTKSHSTFRLSE